MTRTKQIPKKGDKKKITIDQFVKEISKSGGAAKVGSHRSPKPPPRDASGLPSYKGMS